MYQKITNYWQTKYKTRNLEHLQFFLISFIKLEMVSKIFIGQRLVIFVVIRMKLFFLNHVNSVYLDISFFTHLPHSGIYIFNHRCHNCNLRILFGTLIGPFCCLIIRICRSFKLMTFRNRQLKTVFVNMDNLPYKYERSINKFRVISRSCLTI